MSPFPAAVVAWLTALACVRAQERRGELAEPSEECTGTADKDSACPERGAVLPRPCHLAMVSDRIPSHWNLLDMQSWGCRLS